MNLEEFIAGPYRNEWIVEPGLDYYVVKWIVHPEIIVLANCYSHAVRYDDHTVFQPYLKFMRKYANKIPFKAEQVFNVNLMRFYEFHKWQGYTIGGVPQYASPLCMEMFGYSQYLNPYGSEEKPSETYLEMYGDLYAETNDAGSD